MQLEGLRHDSAATILRRELMKNDLERERKKFERARERMEDLVVRAPLSGQLSFVKVTPGQQVQSTEAIAEIKVLDQFKIHTSLSEYYIDRITTGLPATITWQNKKYPLRITKVVPEVKDRNFDVDLVFTEQARRTYASEKVSVSRSNSDNRKRPSSSHVATSSSHRRPMDIQTERIRHESPENPGQHRSPKPAAIRNNRRPPTGRQGDCHRI